MSVALTRRVGQIATRLVESPVATRPVATSGRTLARVGTARAKGTGVATYNQRSAGTALDDVPTTELMRQVLDETRELVRLETKLARDELRGDLKQLQSAAILGGVALLLGVLTLSTLLVAVILALGAAASVAFVCAIVLLLGASVLAALAYQRLPKPPLARTRDRLASDVTQLKEHIQ
jgi:uncharacterized membrane protein YqjE